MTTIPSHQLGDALEQQIKILSNTLRPSTIAGFRTHVRFFLHYLCRNYPELETPAQLKRDPHILAWLRSLEEKNPPYANPTRIRIIYSIYRLLNDLSQNGYPVAQNLIVSWDIPYVRLTKPVCPDTPLSNLFKKQVEALSATLRPSTIVGYRNYVDGFLRYLHRNFPEVHTPGQLQRSPHMLGWLQSLAQKKPPFANSTREHTIVGVRRLLNDMAEDGHPVAENLILPRDVPPRDLYLPQPVCPELDDLLKNELRKTDDLLSNALLLIRQTGMRVGECLCLKKDCLRHLGGDNWALHVPLGKLHNERLVPMDDEARRVLDRILSLTGPPSDANPYLILMPNGKKVTYHFIRKALADASIRVGCKPVRPHQLRHTYATMMVRAGISLPALKQILGHRDIAMTLRYVQVTQNDLQREYLLARQKMATLHALPQLPRVDTGKASTISDICGSLDAIRHQLEMYRRQISNQSDYRKLHALLRRLLRIRASLATFS